MKIIKYFVSLLIVNLFAVGMATAAPILQSSYICESAGKLIVKSSCPRGTKRISKYKDLLSNTLLSGTTLRGFYAVTNYAPASISSVVSYATISFGVSLASAPTGHYIAYNEAPPAACPGSVGNPQANPGHLCVYEDGRLNTSNAVVATTAGENTDAKFGAIISAVATTIGSTGVNGTWAVTAP